MPTVTDKISADVLSVENRKANMIGNFGVGFNHIDIQKAKKARYYGIKYTSSSHRLHS